MAKIRGGEFTASHRRLVGRQINAAREKAGLKGYELAEVVGVGPGRVSEWQKGKRTPTTENIVAIANATGVTTDFLLDPDGVEDPKSIESLSRQIGAVAGVARLEILLSVPRRRLQRLLDAIIGEFVSGD